MKFSTTLSYTGNLHAFFYYRKYFSFLVDALTSGRLIWGKEEDLGRENGGEITKPSEWALAYAHISSWRNERVVSPQQPRHYKSITDKSSGRL